MALRFIITILMLSASLKVVADLKTKSEPQIIDVSESEDCQLESALSSCIAPNFPGSYYIEQSVLYFRTMESKVSPFVQPNYSKKVIRWEWPPWLWLTGYGKFNLIWTDVVLKLFPTSYDKIDCRAFDKQPFGRCRVVFNYDGHLCPIYEEFTFNELGEITFIEAWSDYPSLLPMSEDDTWAENRNVSRLANKVPGLGNEKGLINVEAEWMQVAANKDKDIQNLVYRLNNPYLAYYDAISKHEGDLLSGCDKPEID